MHFNLGFFLKSAGTLGITVCTAVTSHDGGTAVPSSVRGPLLGAEALRLAKIGARTEKAGGSSSRGECAGGGVCMWKWRNKHRARIIRFLIKVCFKYEVEVTDS